MPKWVPKCEMWVMGNWNFPYGSQDINVTIETYHVNLKATLKMAKSQLSGRQVDWCIHELLGDVLSHYWYQILKKNWSFVQTRSNNNLLLTPSFVQGKSQTTLWLFKMMMVDMQLSPIWHMNMWITRFTTHNLSGPTMNVSSHKRETYVTGVVIVTWATWLVIWATTSVTNV